MIRAAGLLFAAYLARLLRSRRLALYAGIALLPVAIAVVVHLGARHFGESPPAVRVGWLLVVQALVPLLSVLVGAGVVAEEVEDRTITYLLTRPVPRPAILLGRWLASYLVLVALLVPCAWAVVAVLADVAAEEHEVPVGFAGGLALTVLVGSAVYSALFAGFGAWFKHPVLVGLGYALAFEGFLANSTSGGQSLTVQHHLKSLLFAEHPELVELEATVLFRADLAPPAQAGATLLAIGLGALVVGALILRRRQVLLSA